MSNTSNKIYDVTIKDLKNIIEQLPEYMKVVIPIIDEDDANRICGFRKVRTAGVLACEYEKEEPKVLCLNAAWNACDIADQVYNSHKDVDVCEVLWPVKEGADA